MSVRVTVGIVARNEEEYLASTLESLVDQDFPGEDYEILAAVRADRCAAFEAAAGAAGASCSMIGHVEAGSEISLIDSGGCKMPLGRRGWDHFPASG